MRPALVAAVVMVASAAVARGNAAEPAPTPPSAPVETNDPTLGELQRAALRLTEAIRANDEAQEALYETTEKAVKGSDSSKERAK